MSHHLRSTSAALAEKVFMGRPRVQETTRAGKLGRAIRGVKLVLQLFRLLIYRAEEKLRSAFPFGGSFCYAPPFYGKTRTRPWVGRLDPAAPRFTRG
jgi:hypothetical protein